MNLIDPKPNHVENPEKLGGRIGRKVTRETLGSRAGRSSVQRVSTRPPSFACVRGSRPQGCKVCHFVHDPYHTPGAAEGLCFSITKGQPCQPSLRNILKAVNKQFQCERIDTSLESWAEQGVLLLNTALTVSQGQPGAHIEHWEAFTAHAIKSIRKFDQPIVWILWGRDAQSAYGKGRTHEKHLVLEGPHPSPRNGNKFVEHEDKQCSFVRANEFLAEHCALPIQWEK